MSLKYAYTTLLIKSAGNISIGRMAAIIEGRAVAQDDGDPSASQTYSDKSRFSLSCTESCSCSYYLRGGKTCLGRFQLEKMQMQ